MISPDGKVHSINRFILEDFVVRDHGMSVRTQDRLGVSFVPRALAPRRRRFALDETDPCRKED